MIRYAKTAKEPSSLSRGQAATQADCDSYDASPEAYRSGKKKFVISKGIYGTEVVKRLLKSDQHSKCAFCEARFDANVAGDVEHYRPKGAISGTPTGDLSPGYYWLGYTWSNLSYACPDCNQYKKRDQFPLVDESMRARSHNDDLASEAPLLLDPFGGEDPRDHIAFRGESPHPKSRRGTATIEILDLKRTALRRDRYVHLQQLSTLRRGITLLESDDREEAKAWIANARAQLAAAILPAAKFSAAAADYLDALDAGIDYLPETFTP